MQGDDRYTYPGSGGVLKNLLGITNADELDRAVNAFVSAAWADLMTRQAPERVDRAFLHEIHRTLFHDIFEWAGEVRDVEVAATDANVLYCASAEVDRRLDEVFAELARDGYLQGLDWLTFAKNLADFWAKLTLVHPFRDGNTRSQVVLVARLAELAGYPIAWERVQHDALRRQRLAAAAGNREALAFYIEDRVEGSLW